MLERIPRVASPARIAALWFGVQAIWGAVLGISLQARCAQLAGNDAVAVFGAITASGALAAALTQLIVGPLSDRVRRAGGRRDAFYLWGSLLGIIAVVAFYRAPAIAWLFGADVGLQIALNVVIGPYQAIVPDTMEPVRFGLASAWLAAFASVGNALGAVLAALLGATPLLGIVLAALLVLTLAVTLTHLRAIPLVALPAQRGLAFTSVLRDLFISRAWIYLGFYTMLDYLYFYVASILPKGFFMDATRASGLCILLFTLLGTLGAILAARPADRTDERIVVTIGGSIVAAAMVGLGAGAPLGVLPVAIGAAGIGWGIFLCADWAFACRLLPPAALATTMAIWNLAVVMPQMLAPLVVNLLASRGGIGGLSHNALSLAGAEILIGTLWVWRLPYRVSGK